MFRQHKYRIRILLSKNIHSVNVEENGYAKNSNILPFFFFIKMLENIHNLLIYIYLYVCVYDYYSTYFI